MKLSGLVIEEKPVDASFIDQFVGEFVKKFKEEITN